MQHQNWSVNLVDIFSELDNIINMAAIPKDTIIDYITSSRFAFVKNYNPVALIGIGLSLLLIILMPIIFVVRKYKVVDKLYRLIFFNMLIRLLQGAFLPNCFACVQAVMIYAEYKQDVTSVITSSIILAALVCAVIVNGYISLCKPSKYLNLKEIKAKYGASYTDLVTSRKFAMFQSTLFYIVRSLFVAVLLLLYEYNSLQNLALI